MWSRSENGEAVKPSEIEYSGNNVILRKNFTLIPDAEDKPMHWEYDEWQMTVGEYEVYLALKPSTENPVAPSEKEFAATKNYVSGSMLLIDGTLYKAVRNIPRGSKIVPNLNAVKTNISDVITETK